jgi:hypothetical protein
VSVRDESLSLFIRNGFFLCFFLLFGHLLHGDLLSTML